jgi:hypothetical protein
VRFLLDLITKELDSYEDGQTGLARLVRAVESSIDGLFDVADGDWVEQLRAAWAGLEIVYAMALDAGRSTLDDEERGDVQKAVVELRSLLAEQERSSD